MRIALLGPFPMYPYRHMVPFRRLRRSLVTSWNVNLAKGLARIPSNEVHFFTNASLRKTRVIEDQGVIIHFIGHPPRVDFLNQMTRLQFSKLHFHHLLRKLKPDIIHGIGTDHEYPYIAMTSKFPHVIRLRGIMSQIVRKLNLPRFSIYGLFASVEAEVTKKAKYLISINDYVIDQFRDIIRGKIFKVENAVHPIFFKTHTAEEYDLVFVGMFNRRKRLLNLIQALEQVRHKQRNILLKVIGDPRDSICLKKIMYYIREAKLQEHVEFLGQLPQDEVARAVAKAKILVLPSIEETAPMVTAEAQVLGKPVVATDLGRIRYMVKDGETGFVVPPDDIPALAEKIVVLLQSDALRKAMSVKARKTGRTTYHPDVVAQKTMEAYSEVMGDSK